MVVGSGITGVATARAVAQRGASVLLIDKEAGPAREGSGRAQGSLRVQGRHAAELPLAQEALELWTEAAQDGDFELVTAGNLYIQTRPEERVVLERLVAESHRAGLAEVELLDAGQVRELMPSASGPFLGAMWSPVDAHCQPPKATEHYAARARQAGARLAYGVKALRLRHSAGRVTGVETTHGTISAGAVVVACGVWTPFLVRSAGLRVPIMPVVMSELETAPLPPLFSQTLRAFGFGARQRPGGGVVVSAGLNARVFHGISLTDLGDLRYWLPRAASFRKSLRLRIDLRRIAEQLRRRTIFGVGLVPATSPEPSVDRTLVDTALARMSVVIPGMAGVRVACYWGGLVDMSPDGLPIIDGACGPAGLTVIAGLSGHGFTLGPVLGEICADLSLDGTTTRPIEPFGLSRYSERRVDQPEMII